MFTGITKDVCVAAWDIILPNIHSASLANLVNKFAGTFVVLDPRVTYTSQTIEEMPVLFKVSIINDSAELMAKYEEIALAKAYITFKRRMPSAIVQQRFPYLYNEGDTKWGGSTITEGGLIVAFSGVEAYGDEWFSELMASTITFLCRRGMLNKNDGVMTLESGFIGEG